jgi:hypothetical protein
MNKEQDIQPLLSSIVQDNPTYVFPIKTIQLELNNMYLNQEEFDYFLMMGFRKLKKQHNQIIANIFITTCELVLGLREIDIHTIPVEKYYGKIEELYETLDALQITRIDKGTPDGILMSAMQ